MTQPLQDSTQQIGRLPSLQGKKWALAAIGGTFAAAALIAGCGSDTEEAAKSIDVTYEVTGTMAEAVVSYTTDGTDKNAETVPLPWTKSFTMSGPTLDPTVAVLFTDDLSGSASCRIIVNGSVENENTTTTAASPALCQAVFE